MSTDDCDIDITGGEILRSERDGLLEEGGDALEARTAGVPLDIDRAGFSPLGEILPLLSPEIEGRVLGIERNRVCDLDLGLASGLSGGRGSGWRQAMEA